MFTVLDMHMDTMDMVDAQCPSTRATIVMRLIREGLSWATHEAHLHQYRHQSHQHHHCHYKEEEEEEEE